MNDKDNYDLEDKAEKKTEPATRARNRTVMLTPEITGQVRAKLSQGGTLAAMPYRETDVAATISPQSIAPGQGFYSQVVQPALVEPEKIPPPPRPTQAIMLPPQAEVRAENSQGLIAAIATPESQAATLPDLGVWVNESPLMGFLVSYDRNQLGEVCSLRSGRMIVSSAPQATGNYLLVEHASVSTLHAIMRITASGEIQVLDQLSESGTFIRRFGAEDEIELSGEKSFLEHGDRIRFGERSFYVVLVLRNDNEG